MRFDTFSRRQLEALSWWCDDSPHRERDAVICDGAVRSGKTLCMSLSFALWSMERFSGQSFALCGKTVTSLRRNLVTPLTEALAEAGVACEHKVSQSLLILRRGLRQNRYYLFGGRDERAAALIQGVTLAGVLLDEVALMPRSFVEQALARCSVAGFKFWFSCNPDHPGHWFHREWIKEAERKNALYLHFSLEDNPSLSPEIAGRYKALYTGVFHERYVLGRWVTAHGAVYPMFCEARHVVDAAPACARHVISCDYGTVNPSSFGLWGCAEGVWIRLREYYHDSRKEGVQRTDAEYADALEALAGDLEIEAVVVDPSAASFLECLRRRGKFRVAAAKNDVLYGIRLVTAALAADKIKFHSSCRDCIRELGLYRWDLESGRDAPRKEHDHAMDDMRYFAAYALGDGGDRNPFAAVAASRSA